MPVLQARRALDALTSRSGDRARPARRAAAPRAAPRGRAGAGARSSTSVFHSPQPGTARASAALCVAAGGAGEDGGRLGHLTEPRGAGRSNPPPGIG